MTYVIDYYNSSVKKEIDGWPQKTPLKELNLARKRQKEIHS